MRGGIKRVWGIFSVTSWNLILALCSKQIFKIKDNRWLYRKSIKIKILELWLKVLGIPIQTVKKSSSRTKIKRVEAITWIFLRNSGTTFTIGFETVTRLRKASHLLKEFPNRPLSHSCSSKHPCRSKITIQSLSLAKWGQKSNSQPSSQRSLSPPQVQISRRSSRVTSTWCYKWANLKTKSRISFWFNT